MQYSFIIFFLFLFASNTLSAQENNTAKESPPPLAKTDQGLLFTIKGSNTIGAKLAPHWTKHYLEQRGLKSVTIIPGAIDNEFRVGGLNGEVRAYVDIYAHGSSTGFMGLKDNSADIAMSSRPIKYDENESISKIIDLNDFEAEHVVALDGLAIIVHPENPIKTLSVQQIREIFSGNINNWKELNGTDAPIARYARDHKSGTWETFSTIVLGKNHFLSRQTQRFESSKMLSQNIYQNPYGIGFVDLSSIGNNKALAISDAQNQAIHPKVAFIATEDYPLSRRLYMYSLPNKLNVHAKYFLDFIQSDSGQQLVEDSGFISQRPLSIAINDLSGPEEYLDVVKKGERLSINFRFKSNSSALDNKAKQDIMRLVDYMQAPEQRNKIIQLIGFGNTKDRNRRSLLLSKLRATSVKTELRKHSVNTASVIGFGDHFPIASSTGESRHKNQRVEVWIFDQKYKQLLQNIKKDVSIKVQNRNTSNLLSSD